MKTGIISKINSEGLWVEADLSDGFKKFTTSTEIGYTRSMFDALNLLRELSEQTYLVEGHSEFKVGDKVSFEIENKKATDLKALL